MPSDQHTVGVLSSLRFGRQRLVLASSSPRRREALSQLGIQFEVRPADVDESTVAGELPVPYVVRVAQMKSMAVGVPGELVIAADTTVDVDGMILAKPQDEADARRMLRLLSGRSHFAHTAVAVRLIAPDGSFVSSSALSSSEVRFARLNEATIDWYLGTGEPFDKAGSYTVQGAGGALIEWVHGSVSGIVGLPLVELFAAIDEVLDP